MHGAEVYIGSQCTHSPQSQLFTELKIKKTKDVVSSNEVGGRAGLGPRAHKLSPTEFHEMLQRPGCVMLDVRNGYESAIGHFKSPVNPTYLLNTRKFSDTVLDEVPERPVLAYCTGGVRCEALARSYTGDKDLYLLDGGICKYMEHFGEAGYFKGKNFTFDRRRYEPNGNGLVGRCLYCDSEHDNYDHGDAVGDKEVRCRKCRVLCLVCDGCLGNPDEGKEGRLPHGISMGQLTEELAKGEKEEEESKRGVFCGGNFCKVGRVSNLKVVEKG